MVEGLTIMLGVLLTLLYIYTNAKHLLFNNLHAAIYPHLMAKHCPEVGWKSRFFPDLRHETRQHGAVKVWWRGLTIMLGVFTDLVIHLYQCQTSTIQQPTCCYTPLDGQTLPESWLEIEIFSWSEAWNPPTWGCKSMVEGLTIMLGVFTDLVIHLYQCQTSTIQQPTCCYTPLDGQTLPEVGWKSRFFPDLRHETRQHGAVKVWWRDLQSCWECYWPCYTSNQCQTSTIQQPTCCYTPLDGQTLPESWLEIEIFSWSEAWNPPTWGCKSMVEGLTIMLGVLLTLLYIYTNAKHLLFNNLHAAIYPHLMAKHCPEVGWKSRFFPDLRHETRQHGAVKVWWRDLQSCWECSLTLLYIYTNAKHLLFNNLHAAIPHLMAKHCLKLAGNRDFFLIWGMKPANMGL